MGPYYSILFFNFCIFLVFTFFICQLDFKISVIFCFLTIIFWCLISRWFQDFPYTLFLDNCFMIFDFPVVSLFHTVLRILSYQSLFNCPSLFSWLFCYFFVLRSKSLPHLLDKYYCLISIIPFYNSWRTEIFLLWKKARLRRLAT